MKFETYIQPSSEADPSLTKQEVVKLIDDTPQIVSEGMHNILHKNRERHKATADGYNQKWTNWIRSALFASGDMKEWEAAYDQAHREEVEKEARTSPEFQKNEQMLKPVLETMRLQRDNPESVEGEKTVVVFLGGGMSGAVGAGAARALHEEGYGDIISSVVTVSAGAGNGMYFVSGEPEKAVSLYEDECTTKDFLDFGRVLKNINPFQKGTLLRGVMRTEYIANLMRDPKSKYMLDQERVMCSHTELLTVVTDIDAGTAKIMDMKKDFGGDVVLASEATSAITLFRDPVELENGIRCVDGAYSEFPLEEMIERTGATNILVVSNASFGTLDQTVRYSEGDQTILNLQGNSGSMGSMMPRKTVEELGAAIKMKENQRILFEKIQKLRDVKIGVWYAPSVGLDTGVINNKGIISGATADGYALMKETLA